MGDSQVLAQRTPSLGRYERHRRAAATWLARSFVDRCGGSRASLVVPGLWSRAYPETTGYIIPTLLELAGEYPELAARDLALRAGEWLLSLQHADGWWTGGLYPPRGTPSPSVFNTGQILFGMVALFEQTGERRWLEAARRGALWLAQGVSSDGLWPARDYRASETPSYYTHVAWPMLETWRCGAPDVVRSAVERFLTRVVGRRLPNGAFLRWGFGDTGPAYTHTIGYTVCGLLECARLLQAWPRYAECAVEALEKLRRKADLSNGSLPGTLDDSWKGDEGFVCLTGNAQIALVLLTWERQEFDLRIVNAAAKLIDRVCSAQRLRGVPALFRGAVPGSDPIWGPYMRFRYPNWAAKYHCDALTQLMARLRRELSAPCASS